MKRIILVSIILLTSVSAFAGKPLIGITTDWNGDSSHITNDYYNSIIKAGGVPIVLPYCRDSSVSATIVSHLDGIVFVGGEDVSPYLYGEEVSSPTVYTNPQRDTSDMYYMHSAMAMGTPVMGVCRGCQLLNVALGGTLVQDISSQWQGSFVHSMPEGIFHEVKVLKNKGLWKYLKKTGIKVNSHHHQAVKTTGPGCRITMVATDGVTEAFECPKKNCFGIQSHPEVYACKGKQPYLEIYRHFVEICSDNQKEHSKTKLIGITTGYDGSWMINQSNALCLSVINAGGYPVLLPNCNDAVVSDEIIGHLAGMILSGGEDVDPQWYGEETTADNVSVNAERDTTEMLFINSALKNNVKIMGICRGMQILNVALGGTLVQDIPSQWAGSFDHRINDGGLHELRIERDRDIWSVLKQSACQVNSRHHQSVKDIAPGCQITATAADGVVEAFDCQEKGLIAVQFHPESFAWNKVQPYLSIFQVFVKMCESE